MMLHMNPSAYEAVHVIELDSPLPLEALAVFTSHAALCFHVLYPCLKTCAESSGLHGAPARMQAVAQPAQSPRAQQPHGSKVGPPAYIL